MERVDGVFEDMDISTGACMASVSGVSATIAGYRVARAQKGAAALDDHMAANDWVRSDVVTVVILTGVTFSASRTATHSPIHDPALWKNSYLRLPPSHHTISSYHVQRVVLAEDLRRNERLDGAQTQGRNSDSRTLLNDHRWELTGCSR